MFQKDRTSSKWLRRLLLTVDVRKSPIVSKEIDSVPQSSEVSVDMSPIVVISVSHKSDLVTSFWNMHCSIRVLALVILRCLRL